MSKLFTARLSISLALAFSFAVSLLPAAPRGRQDAGKPEAKPPARAAAAPAAFAPDKGKFRILLNGVEAGTETFDLAPSGSGWVARGESVIKVPGSGEMRSTGQLRLGADGAPSRYDWTSQSPKKASGSVDFMAGTAKTSMNADGKDAKADFTFPSPRIAVLDNNLYDQYGILARLYDWNAKGTQTFPVLIPQDVTPGTITVEPLNPSNGAAAGLRVRTSDVAIDLYFDANRHLVRLEVPAAKVVVVRQ